jgi:hypothetical protein
MAGLDGLYVSGVSTALVFMLMFFVSLKFNKILALIFRTSVGVIIDLAQQFYGLSRAHMDEAFPLDSHTIY